MKYNTDNYINIFEYIFNELSPFNFYFIMNMLYNNFNETNQIGYLFNKAII